MFKVSRVDSERMRYEQLVRFTLIKFEGRAERKNIPAFLGAEWKGNRQGARS